MYICGRVKGRHHKLDCKTADWGDGEADAEMRIDRDEGRHAAENELNVRRGRQNLLPGNSTQFSSDFDRTYLAPHLRAYRIHLYARVIRPADPSSPPLRTRVKVNSRLLSVRSRFPQSI